MKKKLIVGAVCFLLAGVMGFFGLKLVLSGGASEILGKLFGGKGEVVFDETVTEEKAEEIRGLLAELKLTEDVKIFYSMSETTKETGFLTEILVPTTDFYETKERISQEEFRELDRKSTRLNSSHPTTSRMPSSA